MQSPKLSDTFDAKAIDCSVCSELFPLLAPQGLKMLLISGLLTHRGFRLGWLLFGGDISS